MLRRRALLITPVFACQYAPLLAKKRVRQWKSGVIVGARRDSSPGEASSGALGAAIGTIPRTYIRFGIMADDAGYVVGKNVSVKHTPTFAVNDKVQFAIEGSSVYIIDSTGKEQKLTLIQSFGKPPE